MSHKHLYSEHFIIADKKDVFNRTKPRFNAFQTGHGYMGSDKYNRNEKKREDREILRDNWSEDEEYER